jgi:fatty-acyl-CoA synthase
MAAPAGVTLLVETNGVYADTKRLAKLLDAVDSPFVAALWDMHHPYRFMGEAPRDTVANLGGRIRYTHTKDSVMEDGHVRYRMMGEGDLPVYGIWTPSRTPATTATCRWNGSSAGRRT